jgi:hypothetical protein
VSRSVLAPALLALLPPVAAAAVEDAVPLPQGWMGTTSQWIRVLGIAYRPFNLALFAVAGRHLRHPG